MKRVLYRGPPSPASRSDQETEGGPPACPYCQTPTYLRRHNPGCGIKQVLEEARVWLENQALRER